MGQAIPVAASIFQKHGEDLPGEDIINDLFEHVVKKSLSRLRQPAISFHVGMPFGSA
ncbi:hypothetical protein [Arthrobacter oryzae]|uniref:hypothetical protein n=1 Tax=Arthrobacter oryzae TaxID=409290 RepID=UPI00285C3096|nr:hypothetical protein [Arthrobacter oryzae]MDR6508461.1 hypothetical protein [Arthrobacter oryzae]